MASLIAGCIPISPRADAAIGLALPVAPREPVSARATLADLPPRRAAVLLAQAGDAGAGPDAASVDAEPPASPPSSFPWSIAPIRWGGSVSSELRLVGVPDQPRRTQRVDSLDLRASTYIWQPWFAQVSGGLGLLRSTAHGGGGASASGPSGANTDSNAVTGHGTLMVFPMSRFPFQARYERTDSRTSGELTNTDYTTTRAGVRQDYRPGNGSANFSASFDRSVLESASFGRDELDVWEARMTRQFGLQSLDLAANRSRNTRGSDGESLLHRVTARHSYRDGALLSVESLGSVNTNAFRESRLSGLAESKSRFVQLNTFANWRPEEGSPWYVTGGGRVFQSEVENAGLSSESRSLSGNIGANYQLSRKTTLSGSASLTEVSSNTSRDVITTQGAGITHVPDVVTVGPYAYSRNLNANFTNETGSPDGGRRSVTAQFGHNLTRSIRLGEGSTISLNVGQSVSATHDTVTSGSQALLHSAGASWSVVPSERSSAYVGLTAADSRRFGAGENRFQLVNAQASGQVQFDRRSSGSANFTVQAIRSSTPATPSEGFDVNTTGNLSYQHARAFGVPGMRYVALYSINESQFSSRQLGDLNAPRERVSQSLEQRLEYNIGRLETRLIARVAEIEGKRNWLIFFRVARRFGAF